MQKATESSINKLKSRQGGTYISAYLPLHAGPQNYPKDDIVARRLLDTLQDKLAAYAHDIRAKKALDRIKKVVARTMQNRKDITICMFDDMETLTVLYTKTELRDQVYLGHSFALDMLADVALSPTPYYVLALSQHAAHLYVADSTSVKIKHRFAATADVKPMLDELHIDELNTTINTHPTGAGASKGSHGFHEFGSLKDQRKKLIAAYFRKIDAKLIPILQKTRYPIILAGVGYLLPVYRKISKMDTIVSEELHGNMDKISDKKLFELVQPLILSRGLVRVDF